MCVFIWRYGQLLTYSYIVNGGQIRYMDQSSNDKGGGRRTYSEETRLTVTSFTINPTSTGLKSSPGLCG